MSTYKFQKADCVARVWIGGIDSLLTNCTNEAQFYFNGHVNTQQQMAHILRPIHEVPKQNRGALSVQRGLDPSFFRNSKF
jgi:hypothetical protein